MSIVYFLLPIALGMAGFFLAAFLWASSQGQYDDLDTPAHRILISDEEERKGT